MYMETLSCTTIKQSSGFYWDNSIDVKRTSVPFINNLELIRQSLYFECLLKLDAIKQRANERLYQKTEKQLSPKQMEPLDILLEYCYCCNPLVSFYEDKIKVQLNMSNKYMIDFPVRNFAGWVLVGQYKNDVYTIDKVLLKDLKQILR